MAYMKKVNLAKIVTLDFETFYSTEYNMSKPKYNTSAYVRDPEFKVHCCAIKIGNKPSKCYAGKEVEKQLRKIDWNEYALLAHNTAFDGLILAEHYGIVPHYYFDTLSMTRGLHSEMSRANLDTIAKFYGIGAKHEGALENTKGKRDLAPDELERLMLYCNNDNELCFEVFKKQIEVYPEDELDLIDLTVRMFCASVLRVDVKLARQALADELMAKRSEILKSGATEEELLSNQKFAEKLRELGVEPPTKVSLKTGHLNYALAQTDPEFLELLEHENKKVVLLARGRLAAKSTQAETRAERLIQAGEGGKPLPVGYNYYGAKTGRWSGTNKLNLQNLPRVNPKEPKPSDGLRRSIIAPPGHVLVVVDSSQIEARLTAWLAGQQDVLDIFATKGDVYKHMASAIYNKPVEQINKDERFIGKIAVLGLGYGMGANKFQTTLALGLMGPPVDLTFAECKRIVNIYRRKNHFIERSWRAASTILKDMVAGNSGKWRCIEYEPNVIWLPNGMGLHYPGLSRQGEDENDYIGNYRYNSNKVWKKIYGSLLIENIVQALARIVIAKQMLWVKEYLKTLKLKKGEVACISMMTHDEIVSCVPERYADKVLKQKISIMKTAPDWATGLPLDAEGGFDTCYSK